MSILWLGSLRQGYSRGGWTEASFSWQSRLLRALQNTSTVLHPYSILPHHPVSYWRDGEKCGYILEDYEELPIIKRWRYFSAPRRVAEILAERHQDVSHIVTYNFYHPLTLVGFLSKKNPE
jgi:hypothetical protein